MEKILIGIVIVLSGILYHSFAVNSAYQKGKDEGIVLLNQERTLNAQLAEKAKQENAAKEEALKQEFAKSLQEWEKRNEEITAQYNSLNTDLERMRNKLARATSGRGGKPLDPGNTCTAHAARLTELAALQREGTELLAEGLQHVELLGNRIDQLQSLIKQIEKQINK